MIIKDNNQFKGTTLRGFNNTVDNIRNQMATANDPWKMKQKEAEKQKVEAPKTNFAPNKQREINIKMSRLSGGSR